MGRVRFCLSQHKTKKLVVVMLSVSQMNGDVLDTKSARSLTVLRDSNGITEENATEVIEDSGLSVDSNQKEAVTYKLEEPIPSSIAGR